LLQDNQAAAWMAKHDPCADCLDFVESDF